MAAGETYRSKMEGLATCGICRGPYDEPVTIDCQHTFCRDCLIRLRGGSENGGVVTCPVCRKPFEGRDIENLRECLLARQLVSTEMEMQRQFNNSEEMDMPQAEESSWCSKHNKKKKKKYFCHECKRVICKKCHSNLHKSHKVELTKDTIKKRGKELRSQIECSQLREKIAGIEGVLQVICNEKQELRKVADEKEQAIIESIQRKIASFEELQENLIDQLRRVEDTKMKNLDRQKDHLENQLRELKSAKEASEDVLQSPTGDVSSLVKLNEEVLPNLLQETVDNEVFAEDKIILMIYDNTPCNDLDNFMKIVDGDAVDHRKCKLTWSSEDALLLTVKNALDDLINIKASRIHISCTDLEAPIPDPAKHGKGTYMITGKFQKPTREPGEHHKHLKVFIDGNEVGWCTIEEKRQKPRNSIKKKVSIRH